MLYVLEVLKAPRCMPLYILEAVEVVLEIVNGVRCVPWVLGVMLCMLFGMLLYILEAVEGRVPFDRGARVMRY